MAEYFGNDYSGVGYSPDLNQTQPSIGNSQQIIDLFNQDKMQNLPLNEREQSQKDNMINSSIRSGQSSAAAGGGLGGMMTSGGLTAGLMGAGPVGWGVMGGGMVLSAIEKKKAEEAAREQAKIDNEMNARKQKIAIAMNSANDEFRLA